MRHVWTKKRAIRETSIRVMATTAVLQRARIPIVHGVVGYGTRAIEVLFVFAFVQDDSRVS